MRKQLVLIIIFSLLLVSGVFGAFYRDYGYGGGFSGFSRAGYILDDILDLIQNNQFLVDAIVFLVIFLILAKKVFKDKFSEDKLLYIVIGVSLTIGIMMYERQTQYSLIVNSGWVSLIVLIAFAAYMASTTEMTGLRVTVLSVIVLIVGFFLLPEHMPNLYYSIKDYVDIISFISFFTLAWGIWKIMFPEPIVGEVRDWLGRSRR